MTEADPENRAQRLVTWFEANARVLPWRSNPTPYAVLLSELMLQQTRVDTALPFFERFLHRWPDLRSLAAATEEEVVREWAGLGYYHRARNLHRAAQQCPNGLPQTLKGLRELPGVGEYTAGAIASIAFGIPAPAIDGNVERVMSRARGLRSNPRTAAGRRQIHEEVTAILCHGPPSTINQGLMELGALVCKPRRPLCKTCPWQEGCVVHHQGDPESLPIRAPRRPPKPIFGVAGILRRGDAVLLGRRPPGLLGGMWEPIGALTDPQDPPIPELQAAFARCGLDVEVLEALGTVVHVFSHRRLTLRVFRVSEPQNGEPRAGEYTEVRAVALEPHHLQRGHRAPIALSALARKALALDVQGPAQQPLLAAEPPPSTTPG